MSPMINSYHEKDIIKHMYKVVYGKGKQVRYMDISFQIYTYIVVYEKIFLCNKFVDVKNMHRNSRIYRINMNTFQRWELYR